MPDRVLNGNAGNGLHRAVGCDLRAALERVVAQPGDEIARLSYAETSVRFAVAGGDSVTLLLDRRPPVVAEETEPAEIEIQLTADEARQLADGMLPTPILVARGDLPTRGPVRRYMEVEPILRALLARGASGRLQDRDADSARRRGRPAEAIPAELLAIETRDLHKSFGAHVVLAGANLTIPEGAISVILGPSGTGKSVLLQHVLGLLKPDSGDVIVRGRSLNRMSRSQVLALRTGIGVMFQDGALFSAMNIYDNVAFPLRQHTDLSEEEIDEAVTRRLAAVGLSDAAQALPANLSGGMKKRAGLARALVLEPGIVLCDEPDSGLDPVRTALLADLLADQHAETGGTMVVITHNVAMAKQIGEYLAVLWQGRVLESGTREDMLASETPFVRQFLAGETDGPLGMDA